MTDSWLSSRRGKGEFAAVAVLAVAFACISLSVKELYPFSAATMFAFHVDRLCLYKVTDLDGHVLKNEIFGLYIPWNLHDPYINTLGRFGFGRREFATIHDSSAVAPYGRVPSEKEVCELVRQRLVKYPQLEAVIVRQDVIGPTDEMRIGVIRTDSWKVVNPAFK